MTASTSALGPPVLFVEDLARSKAFYANVLGLSLAFEDDSSAGMTIGDLMVLLVTVDSGVELLEEHVGTPRGLRTTNVFNLFVDDVDRWYSRLSDQGVEFLVAPKDRAWGRRTAHLRDPDGFVWEISQSIQ